MSNYKKAVATVAIAHKLRALGWKLYGYTEDQPSSRTDYFSPASWKGVATKGGAVAMVDVATYTVEQYSGKPETVYVQADGPCSGCAGTGKEPRDVPALTMSTIVGNVVNRTAARKAGDPCDACKGAGRRVEEREQDGEVWPVFQACRGRWLVRIGARVVTSGQRPLAAEHDTQAAAKVAEEIDASLVRAAVRAVMASKVTASNGDGAGVSTNERGNVEVRFPSKPSAEVRDRLKHAGFRWSGADCCWYARATDENMSLAREVAPV